jgi:phospholipid transport system substrate-binding protein
VKRPGVKLFGTAMAALVLIVAAPAWAQSDPAAAQVEAFDASLIEAMKAAKGTTVQARYHRLEPAVSRAFDVPTMIRFAVGPSWSTIPAGQQQALIGAFQRLTVASYAHNFDGYSGERIDVDPNVLTRGPDKVVATTLTSPGHAPVSIKYRMREVDGSWKIIDVFYNGSISQLTTRRSDFAASLAQGGAPALVAHLNALVDKQLK